MATSFLDLLKNSGASFKNAKTTPTQNPMAPMSSASLPTSYTPVQQNAPNNSWVNTAMNVLQNNTQRSLTPTAPAPTSRTLDPATIAAMSKQVTDMQNQASNLLAQRGIPDPLKNAVTAPVAQQPAPQQQMQQQVQDENPMDKFSMALWQMLQDAQAGNLSNNSGLNKKITGMELEKINRGMEETPDYLKVLSPGDQADVRSAASGALDKEIIANMDKIKTNDARLANFVTALDKAESLGKDIKEMIVPSKEVIEGYKNAIIAGADMSELLKNANQATYDAIVKTMKPEDFAKAVAAKGVSGELKQQIINSNGRNLLVNIDSKGNIVSKTDLGASPTTYYNRDIPMGGVSYGNDGTYSTSPSANNPYSLQPGQVYIKATKMPPKGINDALQTSLSTSKVLLDVYSPTLKGMLQNIKTGALEGKFGKFAADKPLLQNFRDEDLSQFDALANYYTMQIVYANSGKQINQNEMDRLSASLPSSQLTVTENLNRINNFEKILKETMDSKLAINGWGIWDGNSSNNQPQTNTQGQGTITSGGNSWEIVD